MKEKYVLYYIIPFLVYIINKVYPTIFMFITISSLVHSGLENHLLEVEFEMKHVLISETPKRN